MAKIRTLINRIRNYFKTIIIIRGGVAEIYSTPFFTNVLIIDFDNIDIDQVHKLYPTLFIE